VNEPQTVLVSYSRTDWICCRKCVHDNQDFINRCTVAFKAGKGRIVHNCCIFP
jgi:hypothetical protein